MRPIVKRLLRVLLYKFDRNCSESKWLWELFFQFTRTRFIVCLLRVWYIKSGNRKYTLFTCKGLTRGRGQGKLNSFKSHCPGYERGGAYLTLQESMIFVAREQYTLSLLSEDTKWKKNNPFFTCVRICGSHVVKYQVKCCMTHILLVNADNHTQVKMEKKKKNENRKMSCFVSQRPNIESALNLHIWKSKV